MNKGDEVEECLFGVAAKYIFELSSLHLSFVYIAMFD